jgi:hypothetical protein
LLGGCAIFPVPTIVPQPAPAGELPSSPPWPAPKDPLPGLAALGIRDYLQEHPDTHIHVHLDVYYQGQHVPVPARLGMDPLGIYIAPLHTHLDNGVIHLQAPRDRHYTLGQVFTAWGVPLTGATAYDRGERVPDPAGLVLQPDHEIAIVYGTPPAAIPVDYDRFWCVDLGICE